MGGIWDNWEYTRWRVGLREDNLRRAIERAKCRLASKSIKKEENFIPFNTAKIVLDYTLFPPKAYEHIIRLLSKGKQKYPDDLWRTLSIKEHINKSLGHIHQHLGGAGEDVDSPSHLINACVRLLFAIELLMKEKLE